MNRLMNLEKSGLTMPIFISSLSQISQVFRSYVPAANRITAVYRACTDCQVYSEIHERQKKIQEM